LKHCQVVFVVFLQYNSTDEGGMKFWDNVNTLIKAQRTTQEWLAGHCGINPSAFRSSVSKGNEPGVLKALKIAEALGTTVEYLVTGIEPPDSTAAAGSKAQEYSQVIDDLKIIDSSVRAGFVSAIHAVAEETRRKKNRQGGSAAG